MSGEAKNKLDLVDKLVVHLAQSHAYMKRIKFGIAWRLKSGKLTKRDMEHVNWALKFLKRYGKNIEIGGFDEPPYPIKLTKYQQKLLKTNKEIITWDELDELTWKKKK